MDAIKEDLDKITVKAPTENFRYLLMLFSSSLVKFQLFFTELSVNKIDEMC